MVLLFHLVIAGSFAKKLQAADRTCRGPELFGGRILARGEMYGDTEPYDNTTPKHAVVHCEYHHAAMASTNCLTSLLRPSLAPALASVPFAQRTVAAAFTTSASLNAAVQKAKPKPGMRQAAPGKQKGAARTLRIKKKAFVKTGRPPAPGERKALRKRIVLSNPNALEVPGLVQYDAAAASDAANIGKVVVMPDQMVDQLRAVEAFKITQPWKLFRTPAILVREDTVALSKKITEAAKSKKTNITILDGARGTGKSMLLLQSMATAFANGWVVISIPEAQDLTNAHTAYAPIPDSSPLQYSQPVYTATILTNIAKANAAQLAKHVVSLDHQLPIPLPSNTTLLRLCELGARDPEVSWPIFEALLKELNTPGKPPVLFACDGLNHIMKMSEYRSPDYELVHAHDLTLVKTFVDYLSGAKKLTNGGAIVAATTWGNRPMTPTLDLALKQNIERAAQAPVTESNPWGEWDSRVAESVKSPEVVLVKGVSRAEARGLMEYWAASGLLRQKVDERVVQDQWTLAGSGVLGEIERGVLRMHIVA